MLPHDQPPPPDPITPAELPELAMAFRWLPCERHPHLGVSVLVGRGFDPICFREDGSAHPVELGIAS